MQVMIMTKIKNFFKAVGDFADAPLVLRKEIPVWQMACVVAFPWLIVFAFTTKKED